MTVAAPPLPRRVDGVDAARGLALIGMFAGIFIFMGFIWAVIGE